MILLKLQSISLHQQNHAGEIQPVSLKIYGVIVTLVPEIVMSSQNSPSMYQNFKVVPNCAFR